MSFLELVRTRYSVRAYAQRPVERALLERCVEAARLAPSACNAQPWHFVLVDDEQRLRQLAAASTSPGLPINAFVSGAPAIAALVSEAPNLSSKIGGKVKKKPFHLMDVGIAAEHFCLQAAEVGLGSCMLGWFDEQRVKAILEVPAKKGIALLISLGYPREEGAPEKTRKTREEIRSWGGYGRQL